MKDSLLNSASASASDRERERENEKMGGDVKYIDRVFLEEKLVLLRCEGQLCCGAPTFLISVKNPPL